MVYCGLVSPHRSVGGDQVTLTAPRVGSGANKTMRGTPTAARKGNGQMLQQPKLAHAEDITVKLSNIISIRLLCTTQHGTVVLLSHLRR